MNLPGYICFVFIHFVVAIFLSWPCWWFTVCVRSVICTFVYMVCLSNHGFLRIIIHSHTNHAASLPLLTPHTSVDSRSWIARQSSPLCPWPMLEFRPHHLLLGRVPCWSPHLQFCHLWSILDTSTVKVLKCHLVSLSFLLWRLAVITNSTGQAVVHLPPTPVSSLEGTSLSPWHSSHTVPPTCLKHSRLWFFVHFFLSGWTLLFFFYHHGRSDHSLVYGFLASIPLPSLDSYFFF